MRILLLWITLISCSYLGGCKIRQAVQNICVVAIENTGDHPILQLKVELLNSEGKRQKFSFEKIDSEKRVLCKLSGSDVVVEIKSFSILKSNFTPDDTYSIAPTDQPVLKIGADGVVNAEY